MKNLIALSAVVALLAGCSQKDRFGKEPMDYVKKGSGPGVEPCSKVWISFVLVAEVCK